MNIIFSRQKGTLSSIVAIGFVGVLINLGVFQVWSITSDGLLTVGHSKIEITPPVGTPLSGYGRRKGKPSMAIHDPIFARALSLTRKNKTFVFTSVDLVLIDQVLRSEVIKKVNEHISLDDQQLVLFATHNHSGSGAIGRRFWQRFIMGKFRNEIFEKITHGIAQAVIESLSSTYPVFAEYGEIRIDSLVENRMDERLSHPSWLKIIQFRRNDSLIVGRLVSMAAHPTILSSSNFQFSADYPGVILRLLEAEAQDSVALFLNGAAGDMRPSVSPGGNAFEEVEKYGRSIFEKVDKMVWEKIDLNEPWEIVYRETKLPAIKIRTKALKVPRVLGSRILPRKSFFQTIRMGRFVFSAIPAEISAEIGIAIENQFLAKNLSPIIVGYANDYLGYIIPRRYYLDRKNYEARASFYGKKMDWFLQEQIDEHIALLLTKEELRLTNPSGKLSYNDQLPTLKLYGDPYHRGFEEGRLLKSEINHAYKNIFHYFRSLLPIPGLNRLIINTFLDRGWKKLEPYISYSEYKQMCGLAHGSGLPLKHIFRIHAIPEIHPTGCSNGAYWGAATSDRRLIAIRNLDWNRDIGVHNYAAVKLHKTPGQKTYVNIGYYGFTGVLSGVNNSGISVGEIGATSDDESMRGVPMPFLLKRVLSQANTLEEAVAIFEKSNLTQGFNYVISAALEKKSVAIEATHTQMSVFYDNDPKELDVQYALPLANAVFRGDPAMDPAIRDLQWASSGNPKKPGLEFPEGPAYSVRYLKHGELIKNYYGQIDVETAKIISREITPKSNIQSVIFAFPEIWVANAQGDLRATDCSYNHFNFNALNN